MVGDKSVKELKMWRRKLRAYGLTVEREHGR
jgi:hypothetical protein